MRANNNIGCSRFLFNLLAVFVICFVVNLICNNEVYTISMLSIAYLPAIGIPVIIACFLGFAFLMTMVQSILSQRREFQSNLGSYLTIFMLLMIPPFLANLIQLSYLGFFFSFFAMIWSFIFAGRRSD